MAAPCSGARGEVCYICYHLFPRCCAWRKNKNRKSSKTDWQVGETMKTIDRGSSSSSNKCVNKTYIREGEVETTCNTPPPFQGQHLRRWLYASIYSKLLQELSNRKQIARQLRTQYVEGIHNNTITLKSRLKVTQGHWKRNHWIDHTRLTITRVIWRWILS